MKRERQREGEIADYKNHGLRRDALLVVNNVKLNF